MLEPVESVASDRVSAQAGTEATAWSRPAEPASSAGLGALAAIGPGSVLADRYEILHSLGEGGMGAVYKARDRELDRFVALKVIHPELARHADILQRFKRELILSRQVTHRNVIRIFDLGVTSGLKFITMEYVEGRDLKTLLAREKFPPKKAAEIMTQVCRGLEAAHAVNVIHRDLKPQNIMVDQQDRAVVMDFGLAHSIEERGMTQTGALMGTPDYMSPEQAKGEQADARSDVFSVGIIFYEMLTGTVPFRGDSLMATLLARTQQRPKPVREVNPEIPKPLSDIAAKCLATDPRQRYQSASEILQDLELWQGSSGRVTRMSRIGPRFGLVSPSVAWKWITLSVSVMVVALTVSFFALRGWLNTPAGSQTPKSVLVTDFSNTTGEPVFNGTLEPALTIALEGASFINTFSRSEARRLGAELQPGADRLDEPLARLVAVRQSINVVVAGGISRDSSGYQLSMRAVDAFTGRQITTQNIGGLSKEGVLPAVAKLAARARKSLGDDTPEALQLSAAENFTAASLEAAHTYAMGEQSERAGREQEAINWYLKAVELDPNLGRSYASLAALYTNQGQPDLAEKYHRLAMARIDRMSDREKYKIRGIYYLMTRNDQKAIEEWSALVKQYPADAGGVKSLALAYFFHRDFQRALEIGRRSVELYPKHVAGRNNFALYAMYAGDFETAAREARAVIEMNPKFVRAYLAVALSELAQGQVAQAGETYNKLAGIGAQGASLAATGLADIALYEGRLTDAVSILEKGVASDLAGKKDADAARKLLMLASANLLRGRSAQAIADADRALALSSENTILFAAAQVLLQAGRDSKALALASSLNARLEPEHQAHGKLIQGEALLKRGSASEAIKVFGDAQKLADTWIGRMRLGEAYLAAKAFTEADSEFDLCLKRRGEAAAVFLDDVPCYHYLPPIYYFLGRARQGLKSPGATDAFRTFLNIKQKGGSEDPLVADARRRLAAH